MSVVDNAIQQLFKNGCKIKKLWTNASPRSSFPAQDITVPSNNADILYIPIKAYSDTESDLSGSSVFITFGRGNQAIAQRQARIVSRGFQWLKRTKISVYDALDVMTYAGTRTNDNTLLIPEAIYGIQLLGGVINKLKTLAASLFRREVLA